MPSFKDFWEKKKHILQFVGIICGVGALFLAIPLPQNTEARDALLNLQFLWLIFIGLGVTLLLLHLFSFVSDLQSFAEAKYGTRFYIIGAPTYIIIGFLITFFVNIWKYASAIYIEPLRNFEGIVITLIATSALFGIDILLNRHRERFGKLAQILFQALTFSFFVIFSVMFSTTVSNNSLYLFSQLDWWKWQIVIFLGFFSAILLIAAFFEHRKNKN